MTGLNAASDAPSANSGLPDLEEPQSEIRRHNLHQGVHVAVVWSDDSDARGRTLTWHIGVVESVTDDGATVAYLVQSKSSSKSNWIFPESATTHFTPYDQIIATELSDQYSCVTIIRCQISSSTVSFLNQLLSDYLKKI